jgi:hypothetical protein
MKTLLCWMLGAVCLTAAPVVTPYPSSAVVGLPGTIVGWGFQVTPDATEWISFTGSLTLNETNPALGFYLDLIGTQGGPATSGVLPPSPEPVWEKEFDLNTFQGLGLFAISLSAPMNAVNSGDIRILYERYSDNPVTCLVGCYIDSGFVDVPFSVTVGDPVPEPSTWQLLLLGVSALSVRLRKKYTRQS